MGGIVCSIVSPHLLDALATSDDSETRRMALSTLNYSSYGRDRRAQHFNEKGIDDRHSNQHSVLQGIVPDHVLEHAASSDQPDALGRELAQRTLDIKQKLQDEVRPGSSAADVVPITQSHRQIYDMQNLVQMNGQDDETYSMLPGKLVRSEGDAPITDVRANQAYDNCATVLEFYQRIFGYIFLDDQAAPIVSSIHFENGYQNAQWVGEPLRQMIYGDGGQDLYNFTACLDVIGHEMTVMSFPMIRKSTR